MPTLVVSTCGTSVLTNVRPEDRPLVTRHANARLPTDVPAAARPRLEELLRLARHRLADPSPGEPLGALSAELHGLCRYYGGPLTGHDEHWLIASDTWLGAETAEVLADVLRRAGHTVAVRRIADLRTGDVREFRAAMSDLVHLCVREIAPRRARGDRVVFNLTGGFKSVQGFLQTLGMLYADECLYVFEGTSELLRLPRLPITLDTVGVVRRHLKAFRRLAVGLPVQPADVRGVPEPLLFTDGEAVTLSVWGELVWEEARERVLGAGLLAPIDSHLRYDDGFRRAARAVPPGRFARLNLQLDRLARHVREPGFNPAGLDVKQLAVPREGATHECDAWEGMRLFGRFQGRTFVVLRLAPGLH